MTTTQEQDLLINVIVVAALYLGHYIGRKIALYQINNDPKNIRFHEAIEECQERVRRSYAQLI